MPPPDEHGRIEAAAVETADPRSHVRPRHGQLGRAQPRPGRSPCVILIIVGVVTAGDRFAQRRQHADDPAAGVGHRRRQHRHDLRHHRRRHRPVGRRDRRAGLGLGHDACRPRRWPRTRTGSSWCSSPSPSAAAAVWSTACSSPTAGSRRSSRRWRCWRPPADWPRSSPTARPRSSRDRDFIDFFGGDVLGVPVLVIIFALVGDRRLGPAQPDHLRAAHPRRRRQRRGGPAGRHRRPPAHRAALRAVRPRLRHRRGHAHGPDDHRQLDARRPLRARRDRRRRHRRHPAQRRPRHDRRHRARRPDLHARSPTSSR